MEHEHGYRGHSVPINMPLSASIGPVLGRCYQHRTSIRPVLAHTGIFTGVLVRKLEYTAILWDCAYYSVNVEMSTN